MYYDDPKHVGPRCCQCDAPVKEPAMLAIALRIQGRLKAKHENWTQPTRYWCTGCYC